MVQKTDNRERNLAVIYARFSCDKQRESPSKGKYASAPPLRGTRAILF